MRLIRLALDIALYLVIGAVFAVVVSTLVVPLAIYITFVNWKEVP